MRTWRHTRGDLTVTERRTRLSEAGAWAVVVGVVGLFSALVGAMIWQAEPSLEVSARRDADLPVILAAPAPVPPPQPAPVTRDGRVLMIRNPAWAVRPTPEYPARAAAAGIAEGEVELECEALAEGRVGACRVIRETPPDVGFAEAAEASMRAARLHASQIDGTDVDSRIGFRVRFRLQ